MKKLGLVRGVPNRGIGSVSFNREQILTNARFAGSVTRYHTWPTHQVQDVGGHTWQLFRIYLTIFGPLSPVVSTYLIWHDAGELALGDLPFPVKSLSPRLKSICDTVENVAVVKMGGKVIKLSPQEKLRTKCVDLIEMLEFGLVEFQMGNKLAQPIIDDISTAIERLYELMSEEDQEAVRKYVYGSVKALGYDNICAL